MADQKYWAEIYGERPPSTWPATSRLSVPVVRHPVCAEHCSGRHEVEAVLACPACKAPAFRLVAHEWAHQEGHYFYTREPINGAPAEATTCPGCGRPLART
jgi:hypothetical protein